jgi:hypothetical protein
MREQLSCRWWNNSSKRHLTNIIRQILMPSRIQVVVLLIFFKMPSKNVEFYERI